LKTKINCILIANRGEIASRIIRTCKKLGITSIAVYSTADEALPFVREADLAICIGEAEPKESYLNENKIIEAAKKLQADAIHPGYGFLSENAAFAERCAKEELIFIGPNPAAIKAMGSKAKAKSLMEKHGVPTIPGYKANDQSLKTLTAEAIKTGFPLLLKATAGGGGKGMRIVQNKNELQTAIEAAKREAQNAFGDDDLIVEKYIEAGRHIEFQIFGDQHGNVIHLLERECTIQRRYQKVLEESPSPVLTETLRTQMGEAAVKAAQALRYDNAGTVEFIFDEQNQQFYFLEINTRLQVEHPVTEAITGLDLVEMQIRSAEGLPLNIKQKEVKGKGYAMEVRLYAEDHANQFLPDTGKIHQFSFPEVEGLRIETAIESGSEISIHYDPMIAKIIVWGDNRQTAFQKMGYVLDRIICHGTKTNQNFLNALVKHSDIIQGKYTTHFIEEHLEELLSQNQDDNILPQFLIAATLYKWCQRQAGRTLLKSIPSGWRNSFYDYQKVDYLIVDEKVNVQYQYGENDFFFKIMEKDYAAKITHQQNDEIRLSIDGVQQSFTFNEAGQTIFIHSLILGNLRIEEIDRYPRKPKERIKGNHESPMPGKILKVLVNKNDLVKVGDPLVIISSMKMENTIEAQSSGTVEEVFVKPEDNVEAGVLLLVVNEESLSIPKKSV